MLTARGVEEGEQDDLLAALAADCSRADVSAAERAMLAYALKLTLAPARIDRADVDALRSQGFDERAIHDLCAITAYFAFVNRIADGLGVELET